MYKALSQHKPKISVIIGTYNCKKFLKPAITSVLDQTFKDFELIIVDDGSTDGSEKLIKEFAFKDNRVKYFFLKKNSGGDAVPKNFGIRKAKGEYICLLDSDDLWLKDKLFIQNSYLKKNTIMICTSCLYIDESGKKYSSYLMHYFRKFLQKKFFKTGFVSFYMYNPVIFSSVMIKAKIIKKYMMNENPEFIGIADLDLWLKLFVGNKKNITFINNDLVKIRRRPDSLNRNYRRASIRSMHCVTKNFINKKNYSYFYVFLMGIALRVLKVAFSTCYSKLRPYILKLTFFFIILYFIIFYSPLYWHLGNKLISKDEFRKTDSIVLISGHDYIAYFNNSYQIRYYDFINISKKYEILPKIFLIGRNQLIPEVKILGSLISDYGVDDKVIYELLDTKNNTRNNLLYLYKILQEHNISNVTIITSPYHTLRSKLIWEKNNLDVKAYFYSKLPKKNKFFSRSLDKKIITYEYFALLYNKLKGWI